MIYLAPTAANNVEEQTRLVDDLIAKKVDGIVLVPVDSTAMVPAIQRVNAAKIPIALANTNANGGDRITFSAIENYEAMLLVAEYMAKQMNYKGKVILLEGAPAAQTIIDRMRAFHDTLKKYPEIQVLAQQTADGLRVKGMEVMENLLQAHPQIDAVWCANDEMALGAIEALDGAGRLAQTKVAGFDANNDALKAVRDGRMLVTMDQQAPEQAGQAMKAIIDHLAGKTVPARIVIPGFLVDKSNINLYASRIGN